MAEEYDFLFKSIVVGDGGVGKTALTLRFSKGFFTEDYKMTIGVDFHVKTITIETVEGPIKSKLQIWDTGGQERFSSIRPMYYRGSLGALLIFDLTNSASFEHLPQWIEEIRTNVKNEIPLLLVGNKSDLVNERVVSIEEINSFTRNFNLYYMETSAKTGEGVGDCFYILACLMIGSGVPDQLISKNIVYSPGQILGVPSKIVTTPVSLSEPEIEFEAPPVPEPSPMEVSKSTITFEPEPESEFEAPPVPEPMRVEKIGQAYIFEPEKEPDIVIPEPKLGEAIEKSGELEFKTPDEILSEVAGKEPILSSPTETTVSTDSGSYKPKAVPFTSNVPIPAPPPEGFQIPQEMQPTEVASKTAAPFLITKKQGTSKPTPVAFDSPVEAAQVSQSESLIDYMPETILSKKEKKKLAKLKKKEDKEKSKIEKDKKVQEAREKQEKLIEDMKKAKKVKKEKPKKEKKEKPEAKIPIAVQPSPLASTTSEKPSLFQALTKKAEESDLTTSSFVPFIATGKAKTEESSKLRIIPNVADIKSTSPATPVIPINQKKEKPPASKEIIICKQCGAILSSDYAFCNKCGTKL
ncbi:MAG: GTP-binding protein [Promethearchaeota archaeon]